MEFSKETGSQFIPDDTPQEHPPVHVGQEIHALMTADDWKQARSDLLGRCDTRPDDFLRQASIMRMFDATAFDHDAELLRRLSEKWDVLEKRVQDTIHAPRLFLEYAFQLIALDPVRFSERIALRDDEWDDIAAFIRGLRNNPSSFVHFYSLAQRIDSAAIKKRIHITQSDCVRIGIAIKQLDSSPINQAELISRANYIRPKEMSPFTMDLKSWIALRKDFAKRRMTGQSSLVMDYANSIRYLYI